MHRTKSFDVIGHVDSETISGGTVKAHGWAMKRELVAADIRIRMVKEKGEVVVELIRRISRKDVDDFYQNKCNSVEVGWAFEVSGVKNVELEMQMRDGWATFYQVNLEVNIFCLALEPTPRVWVVDDFYENPQGVREFALQQNFKLHKNYHKGYRTDSHFRPDLLKSRFEEVMGRKIKNWENYPANGVFQYCLEGHELVYHQDMQSYAGVIYLTPDAPPDSGTGLYKSKRTGLMKVTDRVAEKLNRNKDELFSETFEKGFLDESGYTKIDQIGNVFNRLVLWDAQTIHAATGYFGDRKENGRLFQLFFFDSE